MLQVSSLKPGRSQNQELRRTETRRLIVSRISESRCRPPAYTLTVSKTSIFEKIVQKEDSHSQLLCNLLNRSRPFRGLIYRLLTGRKQGEDDFTAQPQVDLNEGGRPDVKIHFPEDPSEDFYVEVKTERACEPTWYQSGGYGAPDKLRFIVPVGWRPTRPVPQASRISFWNELVSLIEHNEELRDDPLFREYRLLIDRRFPSIHIRPEEMQMIERSDKDVIVSLARKMHRTVDALIEQFNGFVINAKRLKTEFDESEDEYGFEIRFGERRLLWVGMLSTEGQLLCAAYDLRWPQSRHHDGFLVAESRDVAGWEVLSLNDLVSDEQLDVVSAAVRRIQSALNEMLAG